MIWVTLALRAGWRATQASWEEAADGEGSPELAIRRRTLAAKAPWSSGERLEGRFRKAIREGKRESLTERAAAFKGPAFGSWLRRR